MTQFLQKPGNKIFKISLLLLAMSLLALTGMAQCISPSLKFHSPVLLSGTDKQEGAVYLFQNVAPGIDAHIEVVQIYGGATLYNIDDSAGIGYYDAFQPYVGAVANDTSYIDWKISFKVSGTSTDTILGCVAVTGVDVDGDNSSLREFIEAATPGSIATDPLTILNVSFDGVRSKAISTIFNIPLIDTSHHEAMFQMNFTNMSTLLYRNGAVSTYHAEQIRQTCIYFKPFFSTSTFVVLPVKLLSFTAKPIAEFIRLDWSATNESDVINYVIEKSSDAKTWKNMQSVNRGTSMTINNYAVIDAEKNAGAVFYRLKQINSRGLIFYSKVIQTGSMAADAVTVTHNTLIKNNINFQIQGTVNDQLSVYYYSMTGSKIKQDRFQIHPGMNSTSAYFSSQLTPGLYFLVVKNNKGEQVHSSRFIKN
ncbi:MAG TPA: hypothetical protein VK616_08305 [Flavitalea sp.]|nr:hypothetical protein [Flavitalea sp.]